MVGWFLDVGALLQEECCGSGAEALDACSSNGGCAKNEMPIGDRKTLILGTLNVSFLKSDDQKEEICAHSIPFLFCSNLPAVPCIRWCVVLP